MLDTVRSGADRASRLARAAALATRGVIGLDAGRTGTRITASAGLDDAAASQAVAFAVERDWLLTEGTPPHSVCLTDAGRIMAVPPDSAAAQHGAPGSGQGAWTGLSLAHVIEDNGHLLCRYVREAADAA